jgi:predicted  nucleic acid-binding Zn-ribbon protein
MLTAVEKLVVLQERDRQIAQLRAELDQIPPQRATLLSRLTIAHASLETARHRTRQLEADRKELELEVEGRKQQIEKYALQQFQTKRNEEYRALSHEIDGCKAEIVKLEDRQLELMEEAEQVQRAATSARHQAEEQQREADRLLAELATREAALLQQRGKLDQGRSSLAAEVDAGLLARYERLRRTKGERVVVGVEHGACGGCHVGLPAQVIIGCRANTELTQCPNCGRILFYTRDMDMLRAE